jgi:RHS repeat-associated protein
VTYTYDGDSERMQKSTGTTYWGGGAGSALLETDNSGNPTAEYIYFNGKRVARRDLPGGGVHYYFNDHLGSSTVICDNQCNPSDPNHSPTVYDYAPYGELHYQTGSDNNHYKFAGKERDAETGLDYFGARYYGSNMGRWMSPDWSAKPTTVPYAQFGNPQSLNLYSYVGNNPMLHFDPDGHCWPPSACAEAVMAKVNQAQAWVQNKATNSGHPALAADSC